VGCEIHRLERFKRVNGIALDENSDGEVKTLPPFLQHYMRSKGSCIEHAQGVFDPFTRILTSTRSRRPWRRFANSMQHALPRMGR
jgi:hypothetical protein